MSFVEQIEVELGRVRERLALLNRMKELAVQLEQSGTRHNVGASKPEHQPHSQNGGGTLDGRILEAVAYQPGRPKGLAKRLDADVEEVKARTKVLVAEGLLRVETGGTLQRI